MKNTMKKIITAVTTALFTLQFHVMAFAETGVGWIKEEDASSTAPFDPVIQTTKSTVQGLYQLLMVIGGAVAVVSGIFAVIKLMSTDRTKRNEGKDGIFWVLIGVAILGGLVFIINLAMSIGETAFSS